ncbi:MAG: hypothetical protein H0T76_27465 [Nannocystis sp.]|nr:hypothetical protein [Nannocystis sp.]MBA3550231.1 hypothetical protein [Nannocystis sp.]
MSSLVPTEPAKQPVYLDRPQRLGIIPTYSFWNQPDVWRLAGPFMGVAVAVFIVVMGALLSGVLSPLTLGLLGGAGTVLLLGLFERYLRRRMRQSAALRAGAPALAEKGSSE